MVQQDTGLHSVRSQRVCVVGVGGGGCRTVSALSDRVGDAITVAINTDGVSLDAAKATTKLQIGAQPSGHGGTGGDPDIGRLAAERDIEMLRGLFSDVDLAIIAVSLGGGTGSGAAPVITRVAAENDTAVIVFSVLPFGFESSSRHKTAEAAFHTLNDRALMLIRIEGDQLLASTQAPGAAEAFGQAVDAMSDGVAALVRVLTAPAMMMIDNGDLRRVGQGGRGAVVALGEGHGDGRMAKAVAQALASPMLEGGKRLENAAFAIVALAGGTDLAVTEVDGAVHDLAARLPDACDFVVGINTDPRSHEQVWVTLIVGESSKRSVASAPTTKTTSRRRSRSKAKERQAKLGLDTTGKGRFKDVEATIMDGEDLDIPTFIRRRIEVER